MARHFTPRDMLRRVPGPLLLDLFRLHAPDATASTTAADIGDPEAAYAVLAALPRDARAAVEKALRQAHDLGTKAGLGMLVAEAQYQGAGAADPGRDCGPEAAALAFALRHPAIFLKVDLIRQSDQLFQRYWQVRTGLADAAFDPTPPSITRLRGELAHAVGGQLREAEGRGLRCTVEYYAYLGREHYFFCYPDDYTATAIAHDEGGRLRRRLVRPTFEVIFCYEPAARSLHVYAPVPRDTRALFVAHFCRIALGCEPPPEDPRRPAYRLDLLRAREFALPFDPADGVTSVRPVKLRFSEHLSGGTRITLELAKDDPRPVREAVEQYLSVERFPLREWHLTQIALEVQYHAPGEAQARRFQFEVTHPHSCSLKNKSDLERSLGEKLLADWGLTHA